ncbi:hypothetical protein J6590_034594 [Homalodisca vitripennis]|nr:hypothetical protein J6590_034594 [Homalodisca vitripennis]
MLGRVVWVETPYRYDLPQHNNLLRKQNEVLKEKCTKYKWAFLGINSLMDRSCYTRHGLHLNWMGKDVLSGVIENYIACVDPLVKSAGGPEQQSACTKNLKECLAKPDLNDSVGIEIAMRNNNKACYSLWKNVKSEENKLRYEYNAALTRYRDNLKTEKAKWYNNRIEEYDNKPIELCI